jgi:hypothetical protein
MGCKGVPRGVGPRPGRAGCFPGAYGRCAPATAKPPYTAPVSRLCSLAQCICTPTNARYLRDTSPSGARADEIPKLRAAKPLCAPLVAAALCLRFARCALLLALHAAFLLGLLALGLPRRLALGALCIAIGGCGRCRRRCGRWRGLSSRLRGGRPRRGARFLGGGRRGGGRRCGRGILWLSLGEADAALACGNRGGH